MKWIRIESLVGSLEDWLHDHLFSPGTPVRVVWEPGLDWRQVVDEIESHPAPWDPALEQRFKYLQETFEQIAQEQGREAAREWFIKRHAAPDQRTAGAIPGLLRERIRRTDDLCV